jgi:hypothetical protein
MQNTRSAITAWQERLRDVELGLFGQRQAGQPERCLDLCAEGHLSESRRRLADAAGCQTGDKEEIIGLLNSARAVRAARG